MEHNLDKAMPKHLLLQDGRWSMTLEELVPLGNSTFRPMSYVVHGTQSIIATIDSTPASMELIKQTLELLKKYPEPSKTSAGFNARDDTWIPIPGS